MMNQPPLPPPVFPLGTGGVDLSNGQVQFNKHLGQLGMHTGVHGMNGGSVTFGRSKDGRQSTGVDTMHGGTANFNSMMNQPMPPPPPVFPLGTGVVDLSNGQVQFNKHL